jgi:hypothetical protein
MDYSILSTELTTDPLGRGYAEMSAEEAANSLNTVNIVARQLVPLWNVKKTAIEAGCWLAIKAAAVSHVSPDVQGAAAIAVDYIDDQRFTNLDMDLTSTKLMLGALVAGSVITQAQADILDALANTTISRATQLNLGVVAPGHIEEIRRG